MLFDHVGSLKKYESVQDVLKDFFELRMKYYILRKDWLLGMLGAESAKLSNQARFILEKIQGKLVIGEAYGQGFLLHIIMPPLCFGLFKIMLCHFRK